MNEIKKRNENLIMKKKSEDSTTTQEKLDFKLNIPCSSFLTTAHGCRNSDEFSEWLSSGQLTSKRSIKLVETAFDDIRAPTRILQANFALQGNIQTSQFRPNYKHI